MCMNVCLFKLVLLLTIIIHFYYYTEKMSNSMQDFVSPLLISDSGYLLMDQAI